MIELRSLLNIKLRIYSVALCLFAVQGLAQNSSLEQMELEFLLAQEKAEELLNFSVPDDIQNKTVIELERRLEIELNSLESVAIAYEKAKTYNLTQIDLVALGKWSETMAMWFFDHEIYFRFSFSAGLVSGPPLIIRELNDKTVEFITVHSGCLVDDNFEDKKEMIYVIFNSQMKELLAI